MKSKYFFLGKFLKCKSCYILLLVFFGLTSCVKNEIQELSSSDVMMEQSFSLPLGLKSMSIEAPSINDTSSIPTAYGRYYYNGLPYAPLLPAFLPIYEEVSLNLTAKAKSDWIKRLTFEIVVENDFPSIVNLEVYLVDADGMVLDQIFGNQAETFTEATYDAKGNFVSPFERVVKVVYDGARLDLLKKTKTLVYQTTIFSLFFNTPVRLSDSTKFKVSIGARAELEYNIKDMNN